MGHVHPAAAPGGFLDHRDCPSVDSSYPRQPKRRAVNRVRTGPKNPPDTLADQRAREADEQPTTSSLSVIQRLARGYGARASSGASESRVMALAQPRHRDDDTTIKRGPGDSLLHQRREEIGTRSPGGGIPDAELLPFVCADFASDASFDGVAGGCIGGS